MNRWARVMLWFWVIMALGWTALLVPSLLWWKDSLLWVIVMSWWANVAASAAAAYGIWSELQARDRQSEEGQSSES